MPKGKIELRFTTEQARKVNQQNHPERVHTEVIVRPANDEEVTQFIQTNSEQKTKKYRRPLGIVIDMTKKLAKGKVAFVGDRMINPVKLDISGLKQKES